MTRQQQTIAAITSGYFLVMFAVSPVSIVLPTLSASLGINTETASWVMTAYLLPLTACLLPAGRLGDMIGHRRLFPIGLALAAVSSLVAGAAPDVAVLLLARTVQGVGAALVSATALPIITNTVDATRRGRATGLVTMSSSLGAMAGVALAPLCVQYLDWRWAFYLPGMFGALAMLPALGLGRDARPVSRARLDWPGTVLLLGTLVAASLSLNHFHDGPETFQDGWRWHLPMHAATAALLVMFIAVERKVRNPLVRLEQLGNGQFSTAVSANGVLHMTMMMTTFSLPFLFQNGMALAPAQTAAVLITMQGSTTAMTLVGGWLYDRMGSTWLCPLSLTMVASGLTVLGVSGSTIGYAGCFAVVVWMGIGSGVFMTTNNTRIMGTLASEYRGFASGMLETTRQYGHTLGVAIAVIGLAAAASGATLAEAEAFRIGFSRSASIMAVIGWAGVLLSAYPVLARFRGWDGPAHAAAAQARSLAGATPTSGAALTPAMPAGSRSSATG